MTRPVGTAPLLMYLEGEVTPSEQATIEARLEGEAAVRTELASVRSIVDGLRTHDDFSGVDLAPSIRGAIASPAAPPAWRHRRVFAVAAAASVLAATALLWFPRHPTGDELRAKGGAIRSDAERWSGLAIYQETTEGGFRRVEQRVKRGGPLAFTYTNLGPAPFRYLVIVGVDARGEHYRYYPPDDGATAIPIQPGSSVQLSDLIEHDFDPGPLVIYAVFANQPLAVSVIDAALARRRPLPGTAVHRIDLKVEP